MSNIRLPSFNRYLLQVGLSPDTAKLYTHYVWRLLAQEAAIPSADVLESRLLQIPRGPQRSQARGAWNRFADFGKQQGRVLPRPRPGERGRPPTPPSKLERAIAALGQAVGAKNVASIRWRHVQAGGRVIVPRALAAEQVPLHALQTLRDLLWNGVVPHEDEFVCPTTPQGRTPMAGPLVRDAMNAVARWDVRHAQREARRRERHSSETT